MGHATEAEERASVEIAAKNSHWIQEVSRGQEQAFMHHLSASGWTMDDFLTVLSTSPRVFPDVVLSQTSSIHPHFMQLVTHAASIGNLVLDETNKYQPDMVFRIHVEGTLREAWSELVVRAASIGIKCQKTTLHDLETLEHDVRPASYDTTISLRRSLANVSRPLETVGLGWQKKGAWDFLTCQEGITLVNQHFMIFQTAWEKGLSYFPGIIMGGSRVSSVLPTAPMLGCSRGNGWMENEISLSYCDPTSHRKGYAAYLRNTR